MSELLYFWDMHDINVCENMGCIGRLLHFCSPTFHALARWVERQLDNKTCHVFSSLFRRQFFTSAGVNECKWPMTVILCVITKCNFHIKFEMLKNSIVVFKLWQHSLETVQLGIQGDILIILPFYTFCMLKWGGGCTIIRGSCSAEQHVNRKHEILMPPEQCVGWGFPLPCQPESWGVRDWWTQVAIYSF